MSNFDIRKAWLKLIEATNNPMASFNIEGAYKFTQAVGEMLASKADIHKVQVYTEALMSFWPDEDELDRVCYEPEFVMALCGMLCESLVSYVRKVSGDPSI